jgi:hypothetical protein
MEDPGDPGSFLLQRGSMLPQSYVPPEQLGDLTNASNFVRSTWMAVRDDHFKASRYFSGDIFKEKVETETDEMGAPLLYPVGVNLVKMMVLSMTDAAFGEWEDGRQIVLFEPASADGTDKSGAAAAEFASKILDDSNGASLFWEIELDRNLMGGGVLRVSPKLTNETHLRWSKIPIDGFYPVFDPEDPNIIIECWYISQVSPEQARQIYGLDVASKDYVIRVEHWTSSTYETTLDGMRIDAYSGINPFKVVPFIYIPRLRTLDWWGDSLAKDIYSVQDELNSRLADIGDALNYHSHPVFWGKNLPKTFNTKNYPITPWALWDFGRQIGQNASAAPEVGILESKNAVSPQAFEYIKFLYDWARTSTFSPPIAFGDDNGGGQRSGTTLEIRLWPLLKALRRSRGYMTAGIRQALYVSGCILAQKDFGDVPSEIIKVLLGKKLTPKYHNTLPRDQRAVVDEVVKLMSTTPPSISPETAQVLLGRGLGEVTRIVSSLEQLADNEKEIEGLKIVNNQVDPAQKANSSASTVPSSSG